jgi:hypothetical protein
MERKTVGDLMKLFQQAVERMPPEQKAEAWKRLDEKLRPWLRKVRSLPLERHPKKSLRPGSMKSPLSVTGTGKRGQITTLDVARELSKYMRVKAGKQKSVSWN